VIVVAHVGTPLFVPATPDPCRPILAHRSGLRSTATKLQASRPDSAAAAAAAAELGPALVGLPDDLCPCPHWGYLLSGRLLMRTADGDREYRAGQAFYWAPGHAPRALEDSEYVDFSPTADFAKVVAHIQGGGR